MTHKTLTHRWNLAFGVILVVAALIRLVGLQAAPPSLYWEEAALGYDAYSILKTGKDFHGNPFPVVAFESFGDYKPSGYFYLTVPFVAIFGLNAWAVRLPSALLGIASVALVWLIAKQLSKDSRVAVFSATTLALLPWHIQFSRAGFEVNAATFFLLMGMYCLLAARKKPWWLIVAALSLAASLYTYHGLRVLAPLAALWTWIFFRPPWWKRMPFYLAFVLGLVASLPILFAIREPMVMQRFAETSLFSTSKAVALTNLWRQEDGNSWWSRIIDHRYWYWGKEIIAGSLSHFSPQFLFVLGDGNQRHQSGLFGLLFHWQLIALLMVVPLLTQRQFRYLWWLFGLVLLATVPPALTNLTPHTLRFLPAAPFVAILLGIGCTVLWQHLLEKRWRMVGFFVVGLIILSEFAVYGIDYAHGYRLRSNRDWQYGYTQLIAYLRATTLPTDTIWITRAYGRPSIYVMFNWPLDPQLVQKAALTAPHDQGELLAVDRFSFANEPPSTARILVSSSPMTNHALLHTIAFLDGKTAFYIYEN